MRSPGRTLAAGMLTLEAFVAFFAGLVAKDFSALPRATAVGGGVGLAVVCLLVVGLLRYPVGYSLGWVIQVTLIASGVWVPMMFGIGALFCLLWAVSRYWGTRIERERAIVAARIG